jgi:hypothetical protein
VRLTLIHSEVEAAYGLRPGFAFSLRVPFDVKQQRVRYTTLGGEPFVPPYGDIHHRSETLRGFSDGDALLLWEPETAGLWHWHFGGGVTLPLGRTVEDPIELGREGKTHEHLQFGSGVFAPEFEVGWSRPVRSTNVRALIQLTAPLTTNSRGYKAPWNVRWSAGPSYVTGAVTTTFMAAGQFQSVGKWHGEADEGTGFSNGGLRLQIAFAGPAGVSIAPSIYRELFSHGLNDETFSQGTTIGLTLSRKF